jgi:predicted MFS family arabinose efflux permease
MKKVLELPAFRRLLVATVFNEIAWWIGSVSLALLVYRRTGSALGASAFFLCSQLGPAVLSPLVVVRFDQQAPHRILAELYALEGAIFGILAWLVHSLGVTPILVLVLIDGVLFMTARVLTRAAWTSVTAPADLLPEANALFSGSLSVCIMVGPALGGGIVAAGGTRAALLVNVAMFAVVAVLVATVRKLPITTSDRATVLGRLRAGLGYVRREPMTRRLIGLQAAAIVFFAISLPVELVLVRHTLHAGATWYGVLLAVWGLGAVGGSGIYARWRRASIHVPLAAGASSLGAGFLMMALAPSVAVAVVGAGIAGLGNGSQYVAFRTALQELTPQRLMAMILSLNESLFQAIPGAGIALGGLITALAGARVALAVGAAGSLVIAGIMWLRLRTSVDDGRNEDGDGVNPAESSITEAATQQPPLTIGQSGA